MKKKKFILVVLCLIVLFSVTGCGSSHDSSKDEYGYYTREDGKRIWYRK